MRLLKSHPILGLLNSYMVDSPQPANISYLWNFGSLLGLCLIIQLLTGIFLAMHYTANVDLAFTSVEHIMRDVNYGWAVRYAHANTASFFFICVYMHTARGLYYGSYRSPRTLPWSIGVIILVLLMAIGFLGYVLPYGQMSLWGIQVVPQIWIIIIILQISIFSNESHSIGIKHMTRIKALLRIGPHNIDILSVIYGSLLGDAHAEKRESGSGTRITFYQEASHIDYLLFLHNLFSEAGYCNNKIPTISQRLGKNGKVRKIIRFRTWTYNSFNSIHSEWYREGKKQVPENIDLYLTPLSLAIWIMDDGAKVSKGLKLCTNSFSYNDCLFLVQVLNKNFKLKASVQSAGAINQYNIYIWKESMDDLRKIVGPFIIPAMKYKLDL